MTILVTYSDSSMTKSKELCIDSALKHGVDRAWPQSPDTISHEFKSFNPVLNEQRGCGYWLWKPYHIYKAIINCQEGDVLIYADAGIEFVAPVGNIINGMDEDIFFFTNGFPQYEWCKGDVVKAINPDYYDVYIEKQVSIARDIVQVQASVIFFRVNHKTKDFVKEWLLWCQFPGFIDDSPSKAPNYKTFAEHRHDQAILSEIRCKYGYAMHFWPTNYSEHIRHTAQPGDTYPTLFNHHRKRNEDW